MADGEKEFKDTQVELEAKLAEAEVTKEQIEAIHPLVAAAHKSKIADDTLIKFVQERLNLNELGVSSEQVLEIANVLAVAGGPAAKSQKLKLTELIAKLESAQIYIAEQLALFKNIAGKTEK